MPSEFDLLAVEGDRLLVSKFGAQGTLVLSDQSTIPDLMVIIENDLHIGGDDGGGKFSNRYDNKADNHIANRWLLAFIQADVGSNDLFGAELQMDDGRIFEVHTPVEEDGNMIVYGGHKE